MFDSCLASSRALYSFESEAKKEGGWGIDSCCAGRMDVGFEEIGPCGTVLVTRLSEGVMKGVIMEETWDGSRAGAATNGVVDKERFEVGDEIEEERVEADEAREVKEEGIAAFSDFLLFSTGNPNAAVVASRFEGSVVAVVAVVDEGRELLFDNLTWIGVVVMGGRILDNEGIVVPLIGFSCLC